MKLDYKTRFAKSSDIYQIINLCEAHTNYEECGFSKENKSEQLANGLFSELPNWYLVI